MSQYVEHITTEGERWDQISNAYYGNPYEQARLVDANPTVPPTVVLPGGLSLLVPIIEEAPQSVEDLPPWRR